MRKPLIRLALAAAKRAGLFRAMRHSRWRNQRLAILCYHALALDDEHLWDPQFAMPPEIFARRLEILRAGGFHVLPLAAGVERLYAGTLPPRSVAITFDDGTSDFYQQALPRLRAHGMPATLYLTTFYCFYRKPVFRMFCSYLLWKGRGAAAGRELPGIGAGQDIRTELGRERALRALDDHVRRNKLTLPARDELAQSLAQALGLDYGDIFRKRILQLVTPDEVREMAAAGQDIQLHTHRHRTPLDGGLFSREIADNRRLLRELTGREAAHFCYPSGVYHREFLTWLRAQQVTTATTCEAGLAAQDSHPLLLPRIVDTNNLSELEFEARLLGLCRSTERRMLD